MGKKVTSSRASPKKAKKQQATMSRSSSSSVMMKVLRPRVYITDVTNFKQLVQELTGNSNVPSPRPIPYNAHIPCQTQPPHDTITTAMIVENSDPVLRSGDALLWDDFEGVLQREDTLSNYFSGELSRLETSRHPQQSQTYEQQLNNDVLLTFRDIEGWLLDIDSVPSWESYITPLEVNACDFIMRDL